MVCWGPHPWGVRRLSTHIKALPPDSATARKLHPWRQEHELMATVADALARIEHHYVSVHSEGTVEAPDPFPRPAEVQAELEAARPEPVTISPQAFAALLMAEPTA